MRVKREREQLQTEGILIEFVCRQLEFLRAIRCDVYYNVTQTSGTRSIRGRTTASG